MYSLTYQPIALTSLNIPGTFTGDPSLLRTISPSKRFADSGFLILLLLPSSLISKAISVARRLSFVFRLILYAIKNSLHPITVAPEKALNTAGPKSGFHCLSFNFFLRPSYSPSLITARFLLSVFFAEFSYK